MLRLTLLIDVHHKFRLHFYFLPHNMEACSNHRQDQSRDKGKLSLSGATFKQWEARLARLKKKEDAQVFKWTIPRGFLFDYQEILVELTPYCSSLRFFTPLFPLCPWVSSKDTVKYLRRCPSHPLHSPESSSGKTTPTCNNQTSLKDTEPLNILTILT